MGRQGGGGVIIPQLEVFNKRQAVVFGAMVLLTGLESISQDPSNLMGSVIMQNGKKKSLKNWKKKNLI